MLTPEQVQTVIALAEFYQSTSPPLLFSKELSEERVNGLLEDLSKLQVTGLGDDITKDCFSGYYCHSSYGVKAMHGA